MRAAIAIGVVASCLGACGTILGIDDPADPSGPNDRQDGSSGEGSSSGDGAQRSEGGALGDDVDGGGDAGDAGPVHVGPYRVFLTSTTYPGVGLAGTADAECKKLAQNGGLGDRFVAWLSFSGGKTAAFRVTGNGPWVDVTGKSIAKTRSQLLGTTASGSVQLDNPIRLTESGQDLGSQGVWTGSTSQGGLVTDSNCNDWTVVPANTYATDGNSGATDERWARDNLINCAGSLHLYCFEIP